MAIYRLGRTQTIDFTTNSVGIASTFGAQTRAIRVRSNSPCCIKIGTGAQTATSNDPALALDYSEYILVTPGQSMSAIRASGGTLTSADGRLWVTEIV